MSEAGKVCPICNERLPLSGFGVHRARPDGRNLYCKSCIRTKVTESRRALKEYRASRRQTQLNLLESVAGESQPDSVPRLTSVDRVRLAIHGGARTQREIAQRTQLGPVEIDHAIADLMLWTREVKAQTVGETRFYYMSDAVELPARQGSVLAKKAVVDEVEAVADRKERAG